MASYEVNNDSVGGWGGFGGFGGGGCGILIFLLILFAVFRHDGGLFGGGRHHDGHRGHEDVCGAGRGPNNYLVDRDVLLSKQDIINHQNDIYEKQQNRLIIERDMKIQSLEGQIGLGHALAPIKDELNFIKCHMLPKPPIFGEGFVPNGCRVPCGERRERRECDFI